MKDDEVAALAPGLYELTGTNGKSARAAVGVLEGRDRWFAAVTTTSPGALRIAECDWNVVAHARRLDGPQPEARARARGALQQALYSRIDDRALDTLTGADYDALIDAAWSALPLYISPPPAGGPPYDGLDKSCESLWDFMQAVAPVVGISLSPHLKVICDTIDREQARVALPTGDARLMRGSDVARGRTAQERRAEPAVQSPGGLTWNEIKEYERLSRTPSWDEANRVTQRADDVMADARAFASADRQEISQPARDVSDTSRSLLAAVYDEDLYEQRPSDQYPELQRNHDDAERNLRRAALAYASAKLAEAGEAGTGAARLLLAQISEEL